MILNSIMKSIDVNEQSKEMLGLIRNLGVVVVIQTRFILRLYLVILCTSG